MSEIEDETADFNGAPAKRGADGRYRYVETGKPVDLDGKNPGPPCGFCKLPPVKGMDGCLGELPGVRFACCGHGDREGYIAFENGMVIRFKLTAVERESVEIVRVNYDAARG